MDLFIILLFRVTKIQLFALSALLEKLFVFFCQRRWLTSGQWPRSCCCCFFVPISASATCTHVCFHCYCYWRGLVEEFGKFMPLLIDCAAHKKGVPRCPESTGGGFWGGGGHLTHHSILVHEQQVTFWPEYEFTSLYMNNNKRMSEKHHIRFFGAWKRLPSGKAFQYPFIIFLRFLTRHLFLHIIIILIFRMLIIVGICKVWCEGSSHHSERTLGAQSTQIWIFY